MIPLPQITKHAVFSLAAENHRLHRNDRLRNHGGHLVRSATRVGQINDDEASQVGKCADGFRQITAGWFLEIKQYRRVVVLAKLIPEHVQNVLPLRCKATENQDHFGSDCVDYLTNFGIVQQQVDELGKLEIINSNDWFAVRSDDEVFLDCVLIKLDIPGRNPVNGAVAKVGL